MMRVLHIISGDLWAGAEVQAFTLLTALQKQPGMQVAAALMNEGELARRLRDHHIPVTLFPEHQLNGIQILCRLRRLMLEWRPDIVHTHRVKENILGTLANKLSINCPSVRTVHGAGEHNVRGIRNFHKLVMRRLDRWCGAYLQQKVIAVSDELAGHLAQEFPQEKLVVVENGVDIDAIMGQIHAVPFRTEEPSVIHVGIVGRLVPVKRVDIYLEMAAMLAKAHPGRHWHFHVFGDGPLHAQLVAQAKALALTGIVTFHGHRADIVACIAALDALVMCSDHEGLPMTMLEAVVVGTPIVAHAVGGLTKVLEKSATANLVTDHTPAGYAKAIVRVLEQETHTRGAYPVLETISSTTNAAKMRDIYNALLHSHSNPGRLT